MNYSVKIKSSAAKAIKKIPSPERLRIIETIDRLGEEPHAGGVLKGEFSGLRRVRVGNYRIIYEIIRDELTVLVVRVGHRKGVYR